MDDHWQVQFNLIELFHYVKLYISIFYIFLTFLGMNMTRLNFYPNI